MLVDNLGFRCNINSRQPYVTYWQCTARPTGNHSLLAQSHNAIRFGGSLHKNNTSCLVLGVYHASVNCISLVQMQITPQKILLCGIVQLVNCKGLSNPAGRHTSSLAFPRPPPPTNTASSIVLDINSTVLLVIAFYCIR